MPADRFTRLAVIAYALAMETMADAADEVARRSIDSVASRYHGEAHAYRVAAKSARVLLLNAPEEGGMTDETNK